MMKSTKHTTAAALLAIASFADAAFAAATPVWVAGAEREMNAFYGFSAAFDTASVADVASGKLKDYKMYFFCNLHHKTPEKERLVAKLRGKGRKVLLPEKPMTAAELRSLFAKEDIHVWNDDADSAIYASASCVALHCATGGEKVIRLPRRAMVTMLYPERRKIAADTDRIVFTPQCDGMSTTIFRWQ